MPNYDEIPRGPIRTGKSQTFDFSDGYQRKIENFRAASVEEARRTHRLSQEAGRVQAYIAALTGDQWASGQRAPWRSKFVDNRLAKCRLDHLAQLTDTRPVIEVSTAIDAYKKTAQVVEAMIKTRWQRNDWDLKLVRTADIADAYGTGFTRFGAAWPGEQSAIPCGPDQVMPIQPGFDVQESAAVLYNTWKSVWWIKQKFPYTTNGIEREILNQPLYGTSGGGADLTFNRPSHIDEVTWNGLSQGMKRAIGIKGAPTQDPSTGQYFKTLEVQELFVDDPTTNDSTSDVIVSDPFLTFNEHNWWYNVAPSKRLFPRKRHLVFAGQRLLSDGPSPYWHGLYPFAMLQFNPVFWSFWGLSKYRDLLPLNRAMNQIVAGCMDLITRALNPTAVTKEGAISQNAWSKFYPDIPGSKLRVGANSSLTDALRYMENPQIPAYVVQMLTGWLAPEFDRMAGSVDVASMGKKKQNPGGDTIDSMRDAQNTTLRLEERMLEIYLRDSGKQCVSNEIQFSSVEYRNKVLGEAGFTDQDFKGDLGTMLPEDRAAHPDFHKNFALTVNAGSLHSGARDREKNVAIQMAGKRLIPIRDMYQKLEIANPDETFKRLIEEEKMTSEATGSKKTGPTSGKREK